MSTNLVLEKVVGLGMQGWNVLIYLESSFGAKMIEVVAKNASCRVIFLLGTVKINIQERRWIWRQDGQFYPEAFIF